MQPLKTNKQIKQQKTIQRDTLKNIKDKSKWKAKKYSNKPQEGRKRETKPKTKRRNRKQITKRHT